MTNTEGQRVLVVYHHLPHYRYAVFSALQNTKGFDFHFAAGPESRDGTIPTLSADDLKGVHELTNVWLGPFLWQAGLLRLIFGSRWDSVIFLGDYSHISTWIGSALLRVRRTPVYFWTIGWHRPEAGFRKWYRLTFYRLANELLLYGEVPRDIGSTMGFDDGKMRVIFNSSGGPSEKHLPPVVDVPAPPIEPTTIGAVIRLNPVKRLDLLIRATALLREGGRNVRVRLVGDGPERRNLEDLARNLDVPLEMPGAAYTPRELEEFYSSVAVTVVPSVAGLTAIQSMRYGRPVITHDNMHEQAPECESIRNRVTGSLYRQGDVKDLSREIAWWIDQQQQSSQRTAADCHGEVLSRWSGEAHAKAIVEAIS